MSIITMIKTIKQVHPESILMCKVGTFCKIYGKDAYIMSYIFGYDITYAKDNMQTCGFPKSVLPKIMATLENKKIDYIVLDVRNDYDVDEKSENGNLNAYEKVLEKAARYVKIKKRIDEINSYLMDNIEKDSIKESIRKIEDIIDESREI